METWSNLDGHVDLAQLYGNVSFMCSFPSNCGKSRCTWSRALLDLAQWNSNFVLLCTVSPFPHRVMWSYSPSRAIPHSKMDANIMTLHDTFICESFMWRCLFQCFALTSTSFKLHVWTHPPRAWCGDPPCLTLFPGTMGSSGIITLLNREEYGNDGNDVFSPPRSSSPWFGPAAPISWFFQSWSQPGAAQDFVVAWGMTLWSCGKK